MKARLLGVILVALALLSGCATGPDKDDYAAASSEAAGKPRQPATSESSSTADSYTIAGETYNVMTSADDHVEQGIASWYGKKFHGKQTANGERYDMHAMTAAHRELPLPSYVAVENLENGREVVVRVNDRGPFKRNRIIDLSYEAASRLAMMEAGTAPVEIRTVGRPDEGSESATTTGIGSTTEQVSESSAKASAGEVDYYVQVGAFAERDNAYRMAGRADAADLAPSVDVSKHRRSGKQLYRVRVGPLSDAEHVDRVTAGLTEVGITDSHVVIEPATGSQGTATR